MGFKRRAFGGEIEASLLNNFMVEIKLLMIRCFDIFEMFNIIVLRQIY